MAESGLKEAIEGLEKLKFAMILMIVLAVFLIVAFIVATFVTVSARARHPPCCGISSSGVFCLPPLARGGGLRQISQGLLLEGFLQVGPVAFYGRGRLSCDFVCGCFGVGGD